MEPDNVALLRAGIQAACAGRTDEARSLLAQVVLQSPQEPSAWLWLSGVVESDEERRRCLERVLALDPNNAAARRGLARLGQAEETVTVRKQYAPISTAAAILYPQSQSRQWQDEPLQMQSPQTEVVFRAETAYDDVWSREVDQCAFCAAEIAWDATRCPACRHKLTEKRFRYPHPSANLYVLFVVVMGAAVLTALHAAFDLLAGEALPTLLLRGAMAAGLLVVAAGLYVRRPWAYPAALVALPLAALVALLGEIDPGVVTTLMGESRISPGLTIIAQGIAGALVAFIRPLEVAAAAIGFLLAIFVVGSDFVRAEVRHVARVEKGLREASDFYNVGRRYAERGMWATAVMHWQRAAAHDPGRAQYQRLLGEAYARLGFHHRALDMFLSAMRLTTDPAGRAELEQVIEQLAATE